MVGLGLGLAALGFEDVAHLASHTAVGIGVRAEVDRCAFLGDLVHGVLLRGDGFSVVQCDAGIKGSARGLARWAAF